MIEISIIIPVYNTEKYLGRCIESVINQTFNNWELILVNDGSSDKSLSICKKYSACDRRLRVITFERNQGLSCARNCGIKIAKGKYILFVDNDDQLKNNALEILYFLCEKYNLDVCIGRTTKNRYRLSITDQVVNGFRYLDVATNECNYQIVVWLKIIKRAYLISKNIRFKEKYNFEDHLFSLQLLACYESRVMDVDFAFYIYNVNNVSSIMHTITSRDLSEFAMIIAFMKDYNLTLTGEMARIVKKVILVSTNQYIRLLKNRGDK